MYSFSNIFRLKLVGNQAKIKSGGDFSLPLLIYVFHQPSATDIHIEVPGVDCEKLSRILKLARTIADLMGSEEIQSAHLAEALQYRTKAMMG